MKIAQITHSYLPNIGGIENYIKRLSLYLGKKGHEVKIYTTDWRVENGREKNAYYFKTDFTIFRNPISIEMFKELKKTNNDIYHFHAPWFFIHLLAERAISNKPKVMTLHGIQTSGTPELFFVNTIYYPLMKHILNKMNIIIAQAENEKQVVIKRYGVQEEKVKIIPNGIEIEKFKCRKKDCKNFINKYNLNEESFKILFVSRLVPHKNPDKLIKSVKKFLTNLNIEVIIIGTIVSKKYFRILQKMAENDKRIHLIGEVNFKDLVAAYNSSNVFVFLSKWDALSASVLEAMCCGLPIITTKVGCIPFIVKEGENGFFLNRVDEKEIGEKILKVINLNKEELKRIKRNNIRKIKRNYNWEDKMKDIIEIYEELIS